MNEKSILNSKYFLYATEFFSGMSVMAVELGASRLMAPYFSSSQIVWTVIIGVIMIAMALGNVWGGRMADKSPSPDRLYGRLLLASVWIALIPLLAGFPCSLQRLSPKISLSGRHYAPALQCLLSPACCLGQSPLPW